MHDKSFASTNGTSEAWPVGPYSCFVCITLLIGAIGEATVLPPVTHTAGRQTPPTGTLKLPRWARGRRHGGSAELLVRLVDTVWVAITTQSQVQTWSTAGLGSIRFYLLREN